MANTKSLNMSLKPAKFGPKEVLQRLHNIPITVRRYFTDVDGQIVAKNTVPVALQTRYPIFLFGEFDRQSGYDIGRKTVAPEPGTYFYTCFTKGNGATAASVTGVTGVNEIEAQINFGDIVLVYTDSVQSPSFFVWFIIKNSAASIASILANSATSQRDMRLGKVFIYEINYFAGDESQWKQDLFFTYADNIGTFRYDPIQPLGIFRTPMDRQANLLTMKVHFLLNQFVGINFYMVFETDSLTLDCKIEKIN